MRSNSSILLAMDTSTRLVGLAVYDGVQVLSESVWTSRDYHTAELAPAIKDVLSRAGIQVTDIGALGVATGPGSFTGLRVGLALAKGLALSLHLPLVGISTLDALAASQPLPAESRRPSLLAAVLQAGRGRLAVGWYQPGKDEQAGLSWKLTKPVEVLTPQELLDAIRDARTQSPIRVCGELNEDERHLLARRRRPIYAINRQVILASPAQSVRRPSFLAELAWVRWQAGMVDDVVTLAPFYLHYKPDLRIGSEPIPDGTTVTR